MVGGLVASRTGLWMYDLAVTQLIQQGVAEDHMGESECACTIVGKAVFAV